jgi:hypothetical protein
MANTKGSKQRTRLEFESLECRTVPAYFGAKNGLSVAVGDVLPGTGTNQVITGTGPGVPATVSIRDTNNNRLLSFQPFGADYTGGVFVAAGDVTGDGQDDLIVSTAGQTNGQVAVFEFINGGMQTIATFNAFSPFYNGGVDVAVGNVTGDATNEIIVSQLNNGATVNVYEYDNTTGTPQYDLIRSFQAYQGGYQGGVTVTAAAIDTQMNSPTDPVDHNYASIITGSATQASLVKIWNAQQPTVTLRASYFAFPGNTTGINVAAGDTIGKRGAEIYVNVRGNGAIRIFNGQTSAYLGTITTYPTGYATMVNMAIGGVNAFNPQDDPINGKYYVHDLVVVAANGSFSLNQVPVVFKGAAAKPAGLNGSKAL